MTATCQVWNVSITLCLLMGMGHAGWSQETDQTTSEWHSIAVAPPNTRELRRTLGGAYFVDDKLLGRYETLKSRLNQVRTDISLGNISSDSAMNSLVAIQEESKILRAALEETKVLVSAFHVYSKTSEQTFPLGDERLVIITGDHVKIRGWDGRQLKCVVEKTIIAKQPPDETDFDAIQVEHELAVHEGKVGLTREQRDEQEREFLESESGQKLTDEQRAQRKILVEHIHHSYDDYLAFQGREANSLQLNGLSYQEGNRSLTVQINSPGGGSVVSSQWQRHATMTVYVPTCKSLAVRGCLVGLDIQDIECDLVLTTHDSKDRKYEGSFAVSGVNGNVTISQVPVRVLSKVSGNVTISGTDEFVNSGTHHVNNTRSFAPYQTHTTQIDQIDGNLQATFLRMELTLSAIEGTLDVVNRYGDTQLELRTADPERTHRVMSESGTIRVRGPNDVLTKTPIYAHTQCGRLHTDMSRDILESVSFSTGRPRSGWHGFVTPSKDRFGVAGFERPRAAIENRRRTAGLDLISHAGMISILTTDAQE